MKGGDTEVTLVWQDEETGVWLRCRPDFLPSSVLRGAAVRAVSDLKFMAPEYCSPHGFSNAIRRFGYHLAAAFYYEGIEAIYGHRPKIGRASWREKVCPDVYISGGGVSL